MPRLVKGAKWTFGWVVVGADLEIVLPPDAWQEYGFQPGKEAIFSRGSRTSGGFSISTKERKEESARKMGGSGICELGRRRFGEGKVVLPPETRVKAGDRLLTVRGSCYGLGFIARGPIYQEASRHPELEVFAP
ncbi:MAG: hypothetical protein JW929_01445 [Anaerolineales bacterium]|nr:hypothetical protein [Anaerolineales bacterium]